MDINWYPGHMAKAKRLMREKMPLIDIVFEVIDGRIPNSSKIKDIDNIVNDKARILIVTKMDLCDQNETRKWIKYYETKGYKVIPLDLVNGNNVMSLISETTKILKEKNEKRVSKGLLIRSARALIIGIPNVGKSTLINKLVSRKVANTGNMPGITKSLEWIRVNKDIELLDSPGILWPRLDNEEIGYNLASTTAIKEVILPLDKVAIHILKKLQKHYPDKLKARYNIDHIDFEDVIPTYEAIGRKFGFLIKGGEIDYDKVTLLIIKDIKDGNIKGLTFDRYE